jgi:hypothetical protein
VLLALINKSVGRVHGASSTLLVLLEYSSCPRHGMEWMEVSRWGRITERTSRTAPEAVVIRRVTQIDINANAYCVQPVPPAVDSCSPTAGGSVRPALLIYIRDKEKSWTKAANRVLVTTHGCRQASAVSVS